MDQAQNEDVLRPYLEKYAGISEVDETSLLIKVREETVQIDDIELVRREFVIDDRNVVAFYDISPPK